MRLGLGLAALGLAAVLCLSGAAARDRIESADRWATAVNTLKGKTRRLQADDDGDDDFVPACPTQLAAWQDCLLGLVTDGTITGDDDGLVTAGTITGDYSYSYSYGCEPCDIATAIVYEVCSSSQPTGPVSACNAEYQTWAECEFTSGDDWGLTCDFTGACTSGPYDDAAACGSGGGDDDGDDEGDDDGDGGGACLDDCDYTNDDIDCAGFTDVASSCVADCDDSLANDHAFYCATRLTEDTCASLLDAAATCACDNFNVCDDGSGITGYSLPSDAVDHGTTNGGWCSGGVDDCNMDDTYFDAAACWGLCALKYPDSLVAIDLNEFGTCCCQDKCECMANIEDGNYVYTDASITTLPADCGGDDDDDYFGPIPATCADAADSEFIRECRGGPVWQQDCVDEWHAYVECKWNAIVAFVDSSQSCALSCADALSSPAPAPAPAPRPTNATALGSDAAAARGPLLATAVLGAAAAAL